MHAWLIAVLLGLVEGLTEFLPVSSTGHLLLAERVLPRQSDVFNVVIQAGAVLAVVAVFTTRLKQLATTLHDKSTQQFLFKLATAFTITAIGGLALKHAGIKLPESTTPVAWATLVGGVLFIAVELSLGRRGTASTNKEVTWAIAVAQGAGQLVAAALPGSSRSGTTILLALMLGCGRKAATEFSFLLGVPTLLAAAVVEAHDALGAHAQGTTDWLQIGIGAAIAAACAFAVVKWLLTFVQHHTFIVFGIYRVILGLALLLLAPEGTAHAEDEIQTTAGCPAVQVVSEDKIP